MAALCTTRIERVFNGYKPFLGTDSFYETPSSGNFEIVCDARNRLDHETTLGVWICRCTNWRVPEPVLRSDKI